MTRAHVGSGWYRDPTGRHDARWWDGGGWSEWVDLTREHPDPLAREDAWPPPLGEHRVPQWEPTGEGAVPGCLGLALFLLGLVVAVSAFAVAVSDAGGGVGGGGSGAVVVALLAAGLALMALGAVRAILSAVVRHRSQTPGGPRRPAP
ncbi:MAG TPA: hypothetical protein VFC99_19940 [Acidimicrobiia bacterium]|nr:hypothetical protein [Acidimicrobiia bacterium]